jgi:hypothetical protein
VAQAEDSPQLVSALKAYAAVSREQKSTLAHVLEGFVHTLHTSSSDASRRVIAAGSWDGHTSWRDEEWVAWRTWMWYKHFCRVVWTTLWIIWRWIAYSPLTVLAVPAQFCRHPYRSLVCFTGELERRGVSADEKDMARGDWSTRMRVWGVN